MSISSSVKYFLATAIACKVGTKSHYMQTPYIAGTRHAINQGVREDTLNAIFMDGGPMVRSVGAESLSRMVCAIFPATLLILPSPETFIWSMPSLQRNGRHPTQAPYVFAELAQAGRTFPVHLPAWMTCLNLILRHDCRKEPVC